MHALVPFFPRSRCSGGGVVALVPSDGGALRLFRWWCCPPELLPATTGAPAGAAGIQYDLQPLPSLTWTSPTSEHPPSEGLFLSRYLPIFPGLYRVCLLEWTNVTPPWLRLDF
jgi:hypothetical protein